jgi:hypothetical protein
MREGGEGGEVRVTEREVPKEKKGRGVGERLEKGGSREESSEKL